MRKPSLTPQQHRVRNLQLACELAGGTALVGAAFCVATALGLALLGCCLLVLGNMRLG